ncbi:MAG: DNA translocase FtsK [Microcoleaceae cyanobacterium]
MFYLTKASEIHQAIIQLKQYPILWLDTEVANWRTSNPSVSLIQVLAKPEDLTGESVYLLDVFNQPDLVDEFIQEIMIDPEIEKVFHNASYDLRFLNKILSRNVTCTLKLAKKIPLTILGTSNRKLKNLATELCGFRDVDAEEQASDWGKRPLTGKQLNYAKMDTVYLAQVHCRLLQLKNPHLSLKMPDSNSSKSSKLYVTNVREAVECPRLFYLGYHFKGKTLFIPAENTSGVGKAFHQLSEDFVKVAKSQPEFKALFKPQTGQIKVENIAAEMQNLFYKLAFYPYLNQHQNQAQSCLRVWQGLTGLIQRWAELLVKNRQYCSADEVINKTFPNINPKLEYNFQLPNGNQQLVRGIIDGLVYDCEQNRYCVVEYKTYQSPDQTAQLIQVALYSYMLHKKLKLPVDSALYAVLPDWQEVTYSWEELEQTVHTLIPHKLQQMQEWIAWQPPQQNPPPPTTQLELCQMCPQQEKCQTYFEISPNIPNKKDIVSVSKAIPTPITEQPDPPVNIPAKETLTEADKQGQQLVETLESFKVNVDYLGAAVGPAFIRIKLKPHLGVKVSSILKLSNDLQVQLGIINPPLISTQAGYVSVDIPRPDSQTAHFKNYIKQETNPADAAMKIAIGVDLNNQLIEADLSDPNTCHFLVGGTTGSGKSEFLRSLLLSLLYRYSPQQLKIALVDPKRVTFPEFEQMPWLYSPVVKDTEKAIELMSLLVIEMESRYQRLEKALCSDILAYNRKQKQPLNRIICIFDEYADFMAEKEVRQELELSIKRLGAMARAAGIHLIIATQRPEATIVTPKIRSNLPGRVALKTASEADSKIVLGGQTTDAAYLLGKGDLLYQAGSNLDRLQSLFAQTIQLPL